MISCVGSCPQNEREDMCYCVIVWLQSVVAAGGLDAPHGTFKYRGESCEPIARLSRAALDCVCLEVSKDYHDAYVALVRKIFGEHDESGMISVDEKHAHQACTQVSILTDCKSIVWKL